MNDHMISAVFDDREDARRAVAELRDAGIPEDSISLVVGLMKFPAAIIRKTARAKEVSQLPRRAAASSERCLVLPR